MAEHYAKPELVKIGRSDRTARLYQLEHDRDAFIERAAREQGRLLGIHRREFFTHALPMQLLALLDAWEPRSAQAAAAAFLQVHPHRTDADCEPFVTSAGECHVCGVIRGVPCPTCNGKSFHADGCSAAAGLKEMPPVGPFPAGAESGTRVEPDRYLRVVAMSAEAAKRFFGTGIEPTDLGPADPERYRLGARVFGFPAETEPESVGELLVDKSAQEPERRLGLHVEMRPLGVHVETKS